MGAYLNKPVTEKKSTDSECNGLIFGASEMQGWRVSMEDAWNALLDFDKSTSMFAVYDGHGGQEVAQYCAKRLPEFIRKTEAYKNGDLKKALGEAFVEIDKSILTDEVIAELRELAGDDADEDDTNEVAMLSEEATIPIEELLRKMKQGANAIEFEKLLVNGANNSGSDSEDSETEGKDESDTKQQNGSKQEKNEEEGMESKDSDKGQAGASEVKIEDSDKNEEDVKEEKMGDAEKTEDQEMEDINDEDDSSDDESDEEDDEIPDDDDVCMPQSDEVGKDSGATAIVALLSNNQLHVANVGDSRCVLCRGSKAVDMSIDHKPEDDTEKDRIEKAGGKITHDGRVNGGLNLSRAIGDHNYKTNENLSAHEQAITAVPDIEETHITKEDKFMILACDGIWNVMSSQEAVDFVSQKLDEQEKEGEICLSKICEQIFEHCLAPDTSGDGSGCDNMTCIIVLFAKDQIKASVRRKRSNQNDTEYPEKKQKCDA
eukprot:gene4672-5281_t